MESDDAKKIARVKQQHWRECSARSKNMLASFDLHKGMQNGDSIVLAALGKTYKILTKLIDGAESKGYEVKVYYVVMPVDAALNRSVARFNENGRLVNRQNIISAG